jgi:asparagine synthase (glutamine-hydrolysing)
VLPEAIVDREDKMGFPVPLTQWSRGPLREFVTDTLVRDHRRPYVRPDADLERVVSEEGGISRGLWGLLSLELWQQAYHDRPAHWERLRRQMTAPVQESEPGLDVVAP